MVTSASCRGNSVTGTGASFSGTLVITYKFRACNYCQTLHTGFPAIKKVAFLIQNVFNKYLVGATYVLIPRDTQQSGEDLSLRSFLGGPLRSHPGACFRVVSCTQPQCMSLLTHGRLLGLPPCGCSRACLILSWFVAELLSPLRQSRWVLGCAVLISTCACQLEPGYLQV